MMMMIWLNKCGGSSQPRALVIHLFILAFFKNEHREKVSGIQAAFLHEEESGSEAAICSPVTPRRAAVADGKADRRSESRRRR